MQTRHEYLMHELQKLIRDRIMETTLSIANGHADDYAKYQRMVGNVEGMKAALELCDEAEKIVSRTI